MSIGETPTLNEIAHALKAWEEAQVKYDEMKVEVEALQPGQSLKYHVETMIHTEDVLTAIANSLPGVYRVWRYYSHVFVLRELGDGFPPMPTVR